MAHDPFFVRKSKKRKQSGGTNNGEEQPQQKKRRQETKRKPRDEHIDDADEETGFFLSEDKKRKPQKKTDKEDNAELQETADEKKVRLAKEYLSQLSSMADQDLPDDGDEDEDEDGDKLNKYLQDEAFREKYGRKRKWLNIADEIIATTLSPEDIIHKKGHQLSVTSVAVPFDGDGSEFYSASKDISFVKWNGNSMTKEYTIKSKRKNKNKIEHSEQILAIAVSSDGKILATGGRDKTIKIWDLTEGAGNTNNNNGSNTSEIKSKSPAKLIETLNGHRDAVSGLCFRQGSHDLYSCSHDRTVKVWNCDTRAYIDTLYGHQEDITGIDCLRRERCVTCSGDYTVRLWKIAEETQLVFRGNTNTSIDCVAMLTEDLYVTGGQDGNISLWNVQKKKPLHVVSRAHGPPLQQTTSTTAPTLPSTNALLPSSPLPPQPPQLQTQTQKLPEDPYWITSVCSVPYSDIFASGSCCGNVRIWRLAQGQRSFSLIKQIPLVGWLNSMAFTHDGSRLIVGVGQEHKLGRWTKVKAAKNGVCLINLRKQKQQSTSLAKQEAEDEDEDEQ